MRTSTIRTSRGCIAPVTDPTLIPRTPAMTRCSSVSSARTGTTPSISTARRMRSLAIIHTRRSFALVAWSSMTSSGVMPYSILLIKVLRKTESRRRLLMSLDSPPGVNYLRRGRRLRAPASGLRAGGLPSVLVTAARRYEEKDWSIIWTIVHNLFFYSHNSLLTFF